MKRFVTSLLVCALFFAIRVNADTHDRWIVITTINYPTKVLDILKNLDGWNILVVADKKTPKDWNFSGVKLLTIEDQQQLPYKILKHVPWNHYGRKNIGYLYAISCGAKIIYETDDDNYLLANTIELLPEFSEWVSVVSDSLTINPYAYFDKPMVWPRGYPLKRILKKDMARWECKKNSFIPVQQGLVDKDPDVDAIFRLTHNEEIYFNRTKMPLVLNKGVMAPFNSQNTVFYYSAFWGLLIPCDVSMRVADIWRGYITQRLLWDMDAHLCFVGSYALQERNQHDLLKDFVDELELYLKVDQLIQLLQITVPGETIADRMRNLYGYLCKNDLIKQSDVDLVYAWLEDLEFVGYEFPIVV